MSSKIDYSDVENIINDTKEQLCNKEEGFEEFERGASIACKNILITIKQVVREGLPYEKNDVKGGLNE